MIVIKNNFEFCMYKMIAPATAIRGTIKMGSVAPDMASLTFPA